MVYILDPTLNDPLSKVRGVGRYLQILKENLPQNTIFTDNIRQVSADSVFINPFYNFLQKPLTLMRFAKKQIAVIHDLIPLKYPEHFPVGIKGKINIFLNKLALKNYDLIITDSEASKKDINNILYIDKEKIKVIYPCLPKIFSIDSRFPTSSFGLRGTSRGNDSEVMKQFNNITIPSQFCLYVGDATWNKNLVNLAKAIKLINVTCVFVGKVFEILKQVQDDKNGRTSEVKEERSDGKTSEVKFDNVWQKELNEFIKETKGDKRFIFLGYVPDNKLIQLYRQARCNVLVSRDEGFGFSYLEAASQSCPSVLSDIQVLHETSSNQGALFANPNNPNKIANAIGEVYFNKDVRNKLGFKAQERAKYFSKNKFANSFLKIINF